MPEEYNSMRVSNLLSVEVPNQDVSAFLESLSPLKAQWLEIHREGFLTSLHQDIAFLLTQVIIAKSDGAWLYSKEEQQRPFDPNPLIQNFKSRGFEGETVSLIEDAKRSLRDLLVEMSEISIFPLKTSTIYLFPDLSRDSPLFEPTLLWLEKLPETLPSATVRNAPLSEYEALKYPRNPDNIQWCQDLVKAHSATDLLNLLSPTDMLRVDPQVSHQTLREMIEQNVRVSVCASRMAEFYTQREDRLSLRTPQARAMLQREIHSLIWDAEQNEASKKVADSYRNVLQDYPEFAGRYGDQGVVAPHDVVQIRMELIRGSKHKLRFPILSGKLGVAPEETFYGYLYGLPKWREYADRLSRPLSQKAYGGLGWKTFETLAEVEAHYKSWRGISKLVEESA